MMFGLQETDVEKVRSVFRQFPEIDKAILYGSRAKGTFKPASDIDLTLVGEPLDLSVLNRIETLLDDLLLPYTFDLSILKQISNPDLVDHIQRVGIEFFTKKI
jgi:predicted nucleotidyltransferase